MNSLSSPGLGTPQTEIPPGTSVSSQTLKMYEQSPYYVRERERGFPVFTSHSSTQFDLDPYTQDWPQGDTPLLREQLINLQRDYTLVSNTSLITDVLADVPALYSLLQQAVRPLRLTFGERKLLLLEALESDEDTILRVLVKLPSDTTRPAELMRGFKRDWWLKNCSRSQASLVFDYETGNGF